LIDYSVNDSRLLVSRENSTSKFILGGIQTIDEDFIEISINNRRRSGNSLMPQSNKNWSVQKQNLHGSKSSMGAERKNLVSHTELSNDDMLTTPNSAGLNSFANVLKHAPLILEHE
jgi:hypothetical protein